MKPDEIDLVATAVFGSAEQILHAEKAGFPRELARDVSQANWHDGVHDNMPIVHAIPTSHFDVRPRPDANAASNSAASNSLAKALREYHEKDGLWQPAGLLLASPLRQPERDLPHGIDGR
jgi:hypothetical protein